MSNNLFSFLWNTHFSLFLSSSSWSPVVPFLHKNPGEFSSVHVVPLTRTGIWMFHHHLLGQGYIWNTQREIAISSLLPLTLETQPTETICSKTALNYSETQTPARKLVYCCLKQSDLHFNHHYIYFPSGLSLSGPGFLLAGTQKRQITELLLWFVCVCAVAFIPWRALA